MVLAPWLAWKALAIPASLAAEAEQSFLWWAASVPALVLASAYRAALEADHRFDLVNAVRFPASMANFLTPLALSAWYGYLAFTLMTTTVFATFISLIHTVLAVGVLAAWCAFDRLLTWVGRKQHDY